jgi:branched-chain amino acid transport system ATP-binding protein
VLTGEFDSTDAKLEGSSLGARAPDRLAIGQSESLVVEGLVKRFGGVVALNEVSFRVEAGQAVGLIGPNGAGKSTLLKLIAGIEAPSAGSVTLGDKRIDGRGSHIVNRLGVAIASQVPRPFAALTVRENVRVATAHRQRGSKRESPKVAEVLEICHLSHRASAKAGSLGLLDLKRLEFARALATEPKVLLLDEVAAGLVGEELGEVIEMIRAVHAAGLSLLVVEHVQRVIHELVDRVLVLDWGKVLAEGTPTQIVANPEVQRIYLGTGSDGQAEKRLRSSSPGAQTGELALLELQGISAEYGSIIALRDVSMTIGVGQIVTVLGANGSGKSTLAATVSGQVSARRGIINKGYPFDRSTHTM